MNASAQTFEVNSTAAQPATLLPAVIGFFFSFRIFIMPLTVLILQADPQVGVGLSLALNFLLLAIVMFHSFGHAPRTLGSVLRLPCLFWVLLFLGFSGCSLIWSVTASLPAAVAFWCGMAADVAMVILLLRTGLTVETSSSLMKGFVYGACGIALVAWIMPAQSDLRLGDEEFLGPNAIGYACAFAVFLAEYLMLVRRDQKRWKYSALFLAVTLLRSLSKTSIIAFLAGQALILFLNKSISRKTKIQLVLGLILVIALFWGLLASYYTVYTDTGDSAESLTGRAGIWAYIFSEAIERPWIGHGFHSVWKVIPPFYRDHFEARHAHNELLQQFYAYGVTGIVMLVGLYSSFHRQIRKLPRSPLRAILLGLLLFVLVRGVADTEVFDLSLPLWAIVMFSAIISEVVSTSSSPSDLSSSPLAGWQPSSSS
ncbi:O-antigen ligase [Granulicella sp. S156]|uniref:O-antigen ligase family protein n=1 Tax=Granulicella sp. S156 TaxID=1747224 RepID=UPI00131CDFCC|nr:O-antigen ligase family protein [Granulicella sp. S156]